MNHPVEKPQKAMKMMVMLMMHAFLIGCVSTSKWANYEVESAGSTTQSGVTYYLSIKPKRRSFEVPFIFMADSSGPPYVVTLHATRADRQKMKTVEVSRILMILPDGTEYEVLQGHPVRLAPPKHNPQWVEYRSDELPLRFREGAKVVVEVYCNAGDGEIVVRGTFVGKKGSDTGSIWDAYWSV